MDDVSEVLRQQQEITRRMNLLAAQQAEIAMLAPIAVVSPRMVDCRPSVQMLEDVAAPVWDEVKSPGGSGLTDVSTQAPLPPGQDPEAVPKVLSVVEEVLAELGVTYTVVDLDDVVFALKEALVKIREERSSQPTTTRVLKHRLRKREAELDGLKKALQCASMTSRSPQSARITPPRRKSFSPDFRVGHLVSMGAATRAIDNSSVIEEVGVRLDVMRERRRTLEAKRQDLLQKQSVTQQSLEQQQAALRKSESWWETQKAAEAAADIDFTAYEPVVAQSSRQCEKITERVRGLLEKLQVAVEKVDAELRQCDSDEALLISQREQLMRDTSLAGRAPSV